jgi:hypothetical protein
MIDTREITFARKDGGKWESWGRYFCGGQIY